MDNIKISKVIFSITFEDKNNHINKTNEPRAIRQNMIHKGPTEKRITLMIAKPDPQTIPKNNSNDSGSNFFFISTIQNY